MAAEAGVDDEAASATEQRRKAGDGLPQPNENPEAPVNLTPGRSKLRPACLDEETNWSSDGKTNGSDAGRLSESICGASRGCAEPARELLN